MGITTLTVLGILCLLGALVLAVRPYLPAAVVAYAGLWLLHLGYAATFSSRFFISWGVVTVIVIALDILNPRMRWQPLQVAMYMTVGAVAGALLGLCAGEYFLIPGCALGTALGQYAFSRTPAWNAIAKARISPLQYFCAFGLKTIVAVSMVAYGLGALAVQLSTGIN